MELITLAAGCFWCTEACYLALNGVISAQSGFSGGHVENPSYRQVCGGTTGHAECVQITFDPSIITVGEILEVFFSVHDPTQLNRQGNDIGEHYRTAIFYHTGEQKTIATQYIQQLTESKAFSKPIVTEVTQYKAFYPAEDYHNNYFEGHGDEPYCSNVVRPKVEKFKRQYADKLKKSTL